MKHRLSETPYLHLLNDTMHKYNLRVCEMAEYFLPDCDNINALNCSFELRMLYPKDFDTLYVDKWSIALCKDRKELLVGLAGCSTDCDTMWQIGIDVLAEYRRQGIALALTSRLAIEILEREKVPFYCAAWSNIGSVRNALRSGFRPAWVELTAKNESVVSVIINSAII